MRKQKNRSRGKSQTFSSTESVKVLDSKKNIISSFQKIFSLERILLLAGIVTSLLALFFSWQANQLAWDANKLAERQLTPQLEVLWIRNSWTDRITGNMTGVGCDNMVRLYNPGSAPATITGYSAELHYRGYTLTLGSIKTYAGVRHDMIPNTINLADSYLLTSEDEAKQRNSELAQYKFFSFYDALELPIQIEAFSARDLVYRVNLSLGALLDSKDFTAGDPSYSNYDPILLDKYAPIDIAITFVLANGESVTTPKVICLYLEKQ
jgi:hypothetical protein